MEPEAVGEGMNNVTLTQTAVGHLRACPKMFKLRDIDGWQLAHEDKTALVDGTNWHGKLAAVALGRPFEFTDENLLKAARFTAMYDAYINHMGAVKKSGIEISFRHPIINPSTGRAAAYAEIAGKIDGLHHDGNEWWVVEHKTASDISGGYIGRLSLDFQIHVYAHYAQELLGCPVAGVLYDVVKKCTLTGGKTETPEAHYVRVIDWYEKNKESAFYREKMRIQDREIESQLWMYYQEILWRSNNNYWPRNSATCINYFNRKCPYFAYCESGDNQLVLQNSYEFVEPNAHLREKLI